MYSTAPNVLYSERLYGEEALFSQGIGAGDFTFLAQDARGPDGSVADTRNIRRQARKTIENLRTALRTVGQDLENLVTLTVFLLDYRDAQEIADALDVAFPHSEHAYPATTFIGVMGLEDGCRITMDAVATTSQDREQICVPDVAYALRSHCHGVRVGDLLFLSGIDAADAQGKVPRPSNIEDQTPEVLNRIETILKSQKLSLGNVCRTFMFLASTEYRPGYTEARKKRYHGIFEEDEFPPNSGIYVKELGTGILLRSVVIASQESKITIHSPKVREAPGLFSQAVRVGKWVFVAGQDAIGFNRQVEAIGDLAGQTEVALTHIKHILEEAGGSIGDVVKTTVYLMAGQDRLKFATAYREFFKTHGRGSPMPAGLTLEVRELAPSCLVEVDAVALLGIDPR